MKIKEFFYYWLPVIVYMGFIFFMSGRSSIPIVSEIKINYFDLVEHLIEYFILAVLLIRLTINSNLNKPFLTAIIISVAYGVLDEVHQLYVPGRIFSFFDMIADAVGSVLVVIFKYNKRLLKFIKK